MHPTSDTHFPIPAFALRLRHHPSLPTSGHHPPTAKQPFRSLPLATVAAWELIGVWLELASGDVVESWYGRNVADSSSWSNTTVLPPCSMTCIMMITTPRRSRWMHVLYVVVVCSSGLVLVGGWWRVVVGWLVYVGRVRLVVDVLSVRYGD